MLILGLEGFTLPLFCFIKLYGFLQHSMTDILPFLYFLSLLTRTIYFLSVLHSSIRSIRVHVILVFSRYFPILLLFYFMITVFLFSCPKAHVIMICCFIIPVCSLSYRSVPCFFVTPILLPFHYISALFLFLLILSTVCVIFLHTSVLELFFLASLKPLLSFTIT